MKVARYLTVYYCYNRFSNFSSSHLSLYVHYLGAAGLTEALSSTTYVHTYERLLAQISSATSSVYKVNIERRPNSRIQAS